MKGSAKTGVGVLLSLILLWWVLRDVSLDEVLLRIRSADPLFLTLSVGIALAAFWIRAIRWGVLLQPVAGATSFQARVGATFIGFTFNNLLPARVGEVARAYSLSRAAGVPIAASFATLVVERLLDGLILLGLLFAAMASPGFPAITDDRIRSGATLVALVMGAAIVALGLAVANPARAGRLVRVFLRPLPDGPREGTLAILGSFARGLTVLRTPGLFGLSVGLTLFQWSFSALSYLMAFRAFQIDQVPYAGSLFLQSFVSFAVAPPSAPGFFGPFEFASTLGLGFWGVPTEQAVSFAIGYHIAGFIPVNLIGAYYIWRLGLSWSGLRESSSGTDLDAGAQAAEDEQGAGPG